MNFSQALDRIKFGQPMSRRAWNDDRVYVFRLEPPLEERINKRLASGAALPWSPTIEDLMASDWKDVPRLEVI